MRHVHRQRWSGSDLATVAPGDPLVHVDPYGDGRPRAYLTEVWTSPPVAAPFGATEVVPSWDIATPPGTWVLVELRGEVAGAGRWTRWWDLGHWTAGDDAAAGDIRRTSVPGQADEDVKVSVDALRTRAGRTLSAWQLRLTLLRPADAAAGPTVRWAGAIASALPDEAGPVSEFTLGREVLVDVPLHSQELHRGHHPEYDGGGEAWCSPTSLTMVLEHWGRHVDPALLDWVRPQPHTDPQVDHVARSVYDVAYCGAGNWAFNTAYAGQLGLDAFVTRLRSLAEAELLVAAGIPLVTSVAFGEGALHGADYVTDGHLVVVVGFTAEGHVVVNDPAAPTTEAVRRVYDRAQLERAWLGKPGGTVYVIRDPAVPLPPAPVPEEPSW